MTTQLQFIIIIIIIIIIINVNSESEATLSFWQPRHCEDYSVVRCDAVWFGV